MVFQGTLPWPYNTPDMALYILAIFLHSMKQKWDQGSLNFSKLFNKSLENENVQQRAMLGVLKGHAGSSEGPRQVLDPMRVTLCVPRVP